MERMKELIDILNKASKAYYQEDSQIMSDHEYDKLYDELSVLEKESGVIYGGSPTQRVGFSVLSSLQKVKHESPILSLDKTKSTERLSTWLGSNEGVISWKLDGLTIVLTYNNGTLERAVTRGNGEVGEDITHNANYFKNLPKKISFNGELNLRGEGIISYSEFERINSELDDEEVYKNPRNLCSGTVRQLNSKIAADRNVMFYAFTLVHAEGNEFKTKSEQLDFLKNLGFEVVEHFIVYAEDIEKKVKMFAEKIVRNDFASDGLVLTYNNIEYSRSLGITAKFPRDSIAFKWNDETAETTLMEVVWNTSRTGRINPVAVFEPVDIEGSTVNRASVHNVSVMEELKLGKGDRIKVYKANMIIPQVAENLTCSATAEIPKVCPVCGGETEIRMLKEGRELYCTNPNCAAQKMKALVHYVSRDAMNIEGLSEETIKKFAERGILDNYTDIYSIKDHKEIEKLPGFGKKSFEKLTAAIEKSKNISLENFINALGINQVGLSNAKLLCRHFDYDINRIISADEEELAGIEGFGEVISHSIHSYFINDENMALFKKALSLLEFIKPAETNDKLKGLAFVITGEVEHFQNRNELKLLIESLGGKVTGSVTGKTSYLINNDKESSSSKNKKAKELNIPIVSEQDFISMIN
ncbi:MAG: NAD-dependent DNA ligase LigA [Candidatus Metalachnospira sp.]|nr:NAD-dependent DNA ligase LigA [Candidatus Metalachnospira sp.]